MLRLTRILKDYREAGTLSALIALWGFARDAVFLTKSGAVGLAYRLAPPDTECMDQTTRAAIAARLTQALKQLSERIHLYVYLLKRPASPLPPATHRNAAVNTALNERAAFIAASASRFFTCEHYMVLLHEGLPRGLRTWTHPWHALSRRQRNAHIDAHLDRAIDGLIAQAHTCAALLSDVLAPVALSRDDVFAFVRRLCNYVEWKAAAAPLKYDAYLDYFVADS
ncbi:MAG TPA: hypothetical protein VKQ05_04275, partial [Gemmatimonadales bacterium]|nr:hypothetical protein [Gemmatimonadales bacterium]